MKCLNTDCPIWCVDCQFGDHKECLDFIPESEQPATATTTGSLKDRVNVQLFIIWLQQQDIFLMKCPVGKSPEYCRNAKDLIDQFWVGDDDGSIRQCRYSSHELVDNVNNVQ